MEKHLQMRKMRQVVGTHSGRPTEGERILESSRDLSSGTDPEN